MQPTRGTTPEWEMLTTVALALAALTPVYLLCLDTAYAIHGSAFRFPGYAFVSLVVAVGSIVLWWNWYSRTRSAITDAHGDVDAVLKGHLTGRSPTKFLVVWYGAAIVAAVVEGTMTHVSSNHGLVVTVHVVAGLIPAVPPVVWFRDVLNVRTRMRELAPAATRPPKVKPHQREVADLSRPSAASSEPAPAPAADER